MSTLQTIPSEIHCFSVPLAIELGSAELAIIVQFFVNVISQHKRLGRNNKDGRTWNYCTRNDLLGIFPYLSPKEIRTRMEKLVQMGILTTENYNKCKWDRTNWYAFLDEERWGISNISYVGPNGQKGESEETNGEVEKGHSLNTVSNTVPTNANKDTVKTVPSYQKDSKQKDPVKRWKLSESQANTFYFLKDSKINSDDATLAYWSKSYSYERLKDVLEYSKLRAPANVGGYMNKILKKEAVVANEQTEINKETAKAFVKDKCIRNWFVLEKYVKVVLSSGSTEEVPFNLEPLTFFSKLMSLYEICG